MNTNMNFEPANVSIERLYRQNKNAVVKASRDAQIARRFNAPGRLQSTVKVGAK